MNSLRITSQQKDVILSESKVVVCSLRYKESFKALSWRNEMFPNKFASHCENPSCSIKVEAGQGFTEKTVGGWAVWCNKCVSHKSESVKKVPSKTLRVLTADGKIIAPYEPENLNLIRSIPGARFDKIERKWSVSLKVSDRHRLLEVAEKLALEVHPSLRVIEQTEQSINAMHAGLYPFQVEGVNFLAHKNKALLGDDMGLGKTVQSLMSVGDRALVVCRAGLKYNWLDEVKKWRPDLKPIVIKGSKNFRWPTDDEIVIVNSDILPEELNTPKKNKTEAMENYWERLKKYRETLKQVHSESTQVDLIVDEAHDYKNNDAVKTRKVKELAKLTRKTIGLSGSPLANRPEDLYRVLDVLGLAKEVFGTWERYQTLFNAYTQSIRAGRRTIHQTLWGKPDPIVPELLRRVMLRRLRSEVLPDLPKKTYTNILVDVEDPRLQKELDSMWEEWGTVLQIDSDLPPFEKFVTIREKLAKNRIPQMLEYIENVEEQGVPLVVFSSHLAPIDAILGRPGWVVINGEMSAEKRQEVVRAFQAGRLKGIGSTIKAGGIGINLTHAWKALFVDLDWSPVANWQAEDRLARIGQLANHVEIVRMISNHPLDLHVLNILSDKIDTIVKAIDNLIVADVKKEPSANLNETIEQFDTRINAFLQENVQNQKLDAKARVKSLAKQKVKFIHDREKNRLKKSLFSLTPERIISVKESFRYMLSICDGATTLDGLGFNKPDATVAHYLLSTDLETEQEIEAAYCMLTRYSRQLQTKYPILFRDK